MVELQVALPEEQLAELNHFAEKSGEPVDVLVRRTLGEMLAAKRAHEERVERFMSLAGGFSSGFEDVAENHDKYLYDEDDAAEIR